MRFAVDEVARSGDGFCGAYDRVKVSLKFDIFSKHLVPVAKNVVIVTVNHILVTEKECCFRASGCVVFTA